jgi:hypothetical protein
MSFGCSQKLQTTRWGTHVLRVLSKVQKNGGRMSLGCWQQLLTMTDLYSVLVPQRSDKVEKVRDIARVVYVYIDGKY